MTAGRHRQPGVAVAHDVDRGPPATARGDRGADGSDVVVVSGEGQVDRVRVDAQLPEPVHHQEPAPARKVRPVHEQHQRVAAGH